MRVRVVTFGCRANKYDSTTLGGALAARGYVLVGRDGPCDVVMVNSCTVTAAADRETRRTLRQLRRRYPKAAIVLTGCLAATLDVRATGVDADVIVPNRGPEGVVDVLDHHLGRETSSRGRSPAASIHDPDAHARLFVKVQDGCDVHCAFCIVPAARGRSRSMTPDAVLGLLHEAVLQGYREVVISGINLGAYGRDLADRPTLASLLTRILDTLPLERIRLGSIEPWGVRHDLVALFAREPRLMPSFHIPLQSGSRQILRAMGRPSTPDAYRRLVDRLFDARPEMTLWLDVMAGFPGETATLFEESFSFIRALPFTKLHVFPYSPRPGTRAEALPGRVDGLEVRARTRRLLDLSRERFRARLHARVGSEDEVLLETGGKGHTRDNLPARMVLPPDAVAGLQGRVVPVRLDRVVGDGLAAAPVGGLFEV